MRDDVRLMVVIVDERDGGGDMAVGASVRLSRSVVTWGSGLVAGG